jgi:hypothetical protein
VATIPKGREVLSSIAIDKSLGARMRNCIKHDPHLKHVAPHRRRAPWIRQAIEEKCERDEEARAGQ